MCQKRKAAGQTAFIFPNPFLDTHFWADIADSWKPAAIIRISNSLITISNTLLSPAAGFPAEIGRLKYAAQNLEFFAPLHKLLFFKHLQAASLGLLA